MVDSINKAHSTSPLVERTPDNQSTLPGGHPSWFNMSIPAIIVQGWCHPQKYIQQNNHNSNLKILQ